MTGGVFFHGKTPPIPENQVCFERLRLYRRMEKAFDSPLVTVVAGSGYGKTYAVYLYLRRIGAYTLWVQMSERDNLAFHFWENLTGALASLNPKLSADLRNMGFPHTQRQFDRYLAILGGAAIPGRDYAVVLDDFHLLNSAPVMRFIEWNAASPLFNFRIVIISRTEPALNLIPLAAKALVSEITVDELRFSEQEIGEYYRLLNITMRPGELKQIYRDTEGWAVALSLIARNIQDSGGRPGYSPSKIKAETFEKIEDDYFAGITGDLRKFLIKLSLVGRWPRDLLEMIAPGKELIDGIDGAGSTDGINGINTIGGMEKISPFIRYDVYRNGYLIHHLFIEFLKKKQNELSEAEIREVYNASAEWCVKNKLLMDAALDYERARNYRGLRSLIHSLPTALPDQAAEFLLGILDRLLAPVEPDSPDQTEDILALRYRARPRFLLALGRLDESAASSREAAARFERMPPGPLRSRMLADACIDLGAAAILSATVTKNYSFTSWFEKGREYALEFPQEAGESRTQSGVYSYVCRVGCPAGKGEFDQFLDALTQAVSLAESAVEGLFYGLDALAQAETAYYRGDLVNAEKFALMAVYKARQKKQYEIESGALFYLLRLSLHSGDGGKVRETFRRIESQLEIEQYFNRFVIYDICAGWFYAHTGFSPPRKAGERGGGAVSFPLKGGLSLDVSPGPASEPAEVNTVFYGAQKTLITAKIFYSRRRYGEALRALNGFENADGRGDCALARLDREVLRAACLCRACGNAAQEKALRALEAAYETAAPNSLDMPFIEMGRDMQFLAGAALSSRAHSIPRPWLEMIRDRASAYGKKLLLAVEGPETGGIAGPPGLTWREKEVLKALSLGWKREKTAAALAISVNSVKAEIGSVYAKLGAHNRADAVRIAAKLKII
jgi:LuxR family maltose regulon positive regulatory protein